MAGRIHDVHPNNKKTIKEPGMPTLTTRWATLLMCFAVTLLTGCKSAIVGEPSYSLAQGCYSLKASQDGRYIVTAGHDLYALSPVGATEAEKFFAKPSGLGTFLLYDREGGFLANDFISVKRHWKASKKAEWKINDLAIFRGKKQLDQQHTLVSTTDELRLLVGKTGLIVQANPPPVQADVAGFVLEKQPDEQCKAFPELTVDAEVDPAFHEPKDPTAPVRGYADLHAHLGFPKAMAGLAMAGDTFSPWGVEDALADCKVLHGRNGALDLLESQNSSSGKAGHATEGYPDFPYWPSKGTNTHTQAYYTWIQRAWLSGLRLVVTDVTGNPTFCELLSYMHPFQADGNCGSDDEVHNQTQYIYDLQNYIDAQEGGPGKGWFRVVTSAAQAREVINQNKLAVVLGAEYGTLFDCTESNNGCTAEYIERKLQEIHDMGIRSVFPIHRFDNAFGGTQPAGGAAGAWMHLSGMLSTTKVVHISDLIRPSKLLFKPIGGHFWELETCPEGVEGAGGITSMRKFLEEDFGFVRNAVLDIPTYGPFVSSILDFAFFRKLEPIPEYTEFNEGGNACNVRPLQDVGRYLLNRMIDKGMIIEVDHMSYNTRIQTLDVVENRQYSGVVSSHNWIENMPELRERIFRLGGVMSPFNSTPSGMAVNWKRNAAEMEKFPYLVGIGIGSDIQGVTSQPSGDEGFVPEYPFKSVDGLVTFTPPRAGNREFDFASEGVANYGLYAEWVENLRQLDERDDADLMEIFMNSAEAYLQMWERAESQSLEGSY